MAMSILPMSQQSPSHKILDKSGELTPIPACHTNQGTPVATFQQHSHSNSNSNGPANELPNERKLDGPPVAVINNQQIVEGNISLGQAFSAETLNLSPRQAQQTENRLIRHPSYSDAMGHMGGGNSCNNSADLHQMTNYFQLNGSSQTSPHHLTGRRAVICKDGTKPALTITSTSPVPLNLSPNILRNRQQLLMRPMCATHEGQQRVTTAVATQGWVSVLDSSNVFNSSVRRISLGSSTIGLGTAGYLMGSEAPTAAPVATTTPIAIGSQVPLLQPFTSEAAPRRRRSDDVARPGIAGEGLVFAPVKGWYSDAGGTESPRFESGRFSKHATGTNLKSVKDERDATTTTSSSSGPTQEASNPSHGQAEPPFSFSSIGNTDANSKAAHPILAIHEVATPSSLAMIPLHLAEPSPHMAEPVEQTPVAALPLTITQSNSPNSSATRSRRLAPIFSMRQLYMEASSEATPSADHQTIATLRLSGSQDMGGSPKLHPIHNTSIALNKPTSSTPARPPLTSETEESPMSPAFFVHGLASLKALRTGASHSPSHPDHSHPHQQAQGSEPPSITASHGRFGSIHYYSNHKDYQIPASVHNSSIQSNNSPHQQRSRTKGSHFTLLDDIGSQNASNSCNGHLFGHAGGEEHHRSYTESRGKRSKASSGEADGVGLASASDPALLKEDGSSSTYADMASNNSVPMVKLVLPQYGQQNQKHPGSPVLLGTGASVHSLTLTDGLSQRGGGVTPDASPLGPTPSNSHRLKAPGDPLSLGCSLIVTPNGTLQGTTFAGGNVVDVRAMTNSGTFAPNARGGHQEIKYHNLPTGTTRRMVTGQFFAEAHQEVISQGSSTATRDPATDVASSHYLPSNLPDKSANTSVRSPIHGGPSEPFLALVAVPSYTKAGGNSATQHPRLTMGGSNVTTVQLGSSNSPLSMPFPPTSTSHDGTGHLVVRLGSSNMSASHHGVASNSRALPCAPPIASGDPSYAPLTEAAWRRGPPSGDDDDTNSESSQCIVVDDEDDIIFQ